MALPRIRGTQIGLRDPALVDRLKSAMSAGQYAFDEQRGQIGGIVDRQGVYHVVDGHHRMAAALELFREFGEDEAMRQLLFWGRWTLRRDAPVDSRPFPGRSTWWALRNWLGF
jgi:hypothetical protein